VPGGGNGSGARPLLQPQSISIAAGRRFELTAAIEHPREGGKRLSVGSSANGGFKMFTGTFVFARISRYSRPSARCSAAESALSATIRGSGECVRHDRIRRPGRRGRAAPRRDRRPERAAARIRQVRHDRAPASLSKGCHHFGPLFQPRFQGAPAALQRTDVMGRSQFARCRQLDQACRPFGIDQVGLAHRRTKQDGVPASARPVGTPGAGDAARLHASAS
jgi:hypothetical protein